MLGSTPEFRDLLYELQFSEVYVLDNNPDSFNRMSALRVYQSPERFIEGDWQQTIAHIGVEFAAILSDLTSGNIPYEERPAFYSDISRHLALDGLFIDKMLTHPIPHLSLAQLARKYSFRPINLREINGFSCEVLFCSELMANSETVDTDAFYDILLHDFTHPRLQAFLRQLPKITPRGCRWFYGKPWQELDHEYCPSLRRRAVAGDERGSPYQGRLQLFVCSH